MLERSHCSPICTSKRRLGLDLDTYQAKVGKHTERPSYNSRGKPLNFVAWIYCWLLARRLRCLQVQLIVVQCTCKRSHPLLTVRHLCHEEKTWPRSQYEVYQTKAGKYTERTRYLESIPQFCPHLDLLLPAGMLLAVLRCIHAYNSNR